MIKFFRKIRQNLLMENKTGKYFKYAIGEIVLVMFGILLALQVSNWNDERVIKKNELKTLKQLNVDLKSNFVELRGLDSLINLRAKAGKKILNHLAQNSFATDSLKYWVQRFGGENIFNNANTTYKNLESNNNTIITNDSLRIRVTLMYETEFVNVHRREQIFNNKHDKFYKEQLFKNFKTDTTISAYFDDMYLTINTPKNYKDLQESEDFKSAIVYAYNFRILRLYWLKNTLNDLEILINDIEKEIKKLE